MDEAPKRLKVKQVQQNSAIKQHSVSSSLLSSVFVLPDLNCVIRLCNSNKMHSDPQMPLKTCNDPKLLLAVHTDPQVIVSGWDGVDDGVHCCVSAHTLCEGQVCEHRVLIITNDVHCQPGGSRLWVHSPLITHSKVQLRVYERERKKVSVNEQDKNIIEQNTGTKRNNHKSKGSADSPFTTFCLIFHTLLWHWH